MDETTHYLSPKILDRVHVLRFLNPVLVDWQEEESSLVDFDLDTTLPVRMRATDIGVRASYPLFDRSQSEVAWLAHLSSKFLDPLGVEFGLRAIRQSAHYLEQAQDCGLDTAAALNNVLMHKVLPKLVVDVARTAPSGEKRGDLLRRMAESIEEKLQLEGDQVTDGANERLEQMRKCVQRPTMGLRASGRVDVTVFRAALPLH